MSIAATHDLKYQSLQLLREYQKSKSPRLRNRIVQLNIGLVRKEAHHWVNQCHESYEDLEQVGILGLIRAIEKFQPAQGNAFSTIALPYIRGEIRHYLRDKGVSVRIPRRWLEIFQQGITVTRKLQTQLNRQPTDAEVAAALKLSLKQWEEIKLAYQNREPLSLDTPVGNEQDGTASLGDLVPDSHYRSFQLAQEDQIRIQQALLHLEERTRNVLEFVFLQDLTQQEAADQLGISVITVSRRVKKGLKILKRVMTTNL